MTNTQIMRLSLNSESFHSFMERLSVIVWVSQPAGVTGVVPSHRSPPWCFQVQKVVVVLMSKSSETVHCQTVCKDGRHDNPKEVKPNHLDNPLVADRMVG